MTKDEALKLALEALEMCEVPWTGTLDHNLTEAITAIKEALAQPEQEPVAWITEWEGQYSSGKILDYIAHTRGGKVEYTPLYTTPPQRPSRSDIKPLTDEEIYDMYNEPRSDAEMIAFARAIEAAHGIKGEA
jgi:hypothetical protein